MESLFKISHIPKLFTPLDRILMAKLTLTAGADLFPARSALSLGTSSQQQPTRCPKHPMTLRFGALTLPQHNTGPQRREHELGTPLGNGFSPIAPATWLGCRLRRLFSSPAFGARPAGAAWPGRGVKESADTYSARRERLAFRPTRHTRPLAGDATHPLVRGE